LNLALFFNAPVVNPTKASMEIGILFIKLSGEKPTYVGLEETT